MELTNEEKALVLSHRAAKEKKARVQAFKRRVLDTAAEWVIWSEANGAGLTFSTFTSPSEFGFSGPNGGQTFEAVRDLLTAVEEIASKGFPDDH